MIGFSNLISNKYNKETNDYNKKLLNICIYILFYLFSLELFIKLLLKTFLPFEFFTFEIRLLILLLEIL